MRIPILWRRRLTFVRKFQNGSDLRRYVDPETGVLYVGHSPYDPFLRRSIANMLDVDVGEL